ncbi:MAG TPA: DUF4139 domain-containing protein [Burkholderiaceae bacterium]
MKRLCLLAAALPALACAQQASRIDAVLVYPGGAQIERVLAVKAGAAAITLPCLPGNFDAKTLTIRGEGVQIGEINAQTVERGAAPQCVNASLEARIRAIEIKRDFLQAESGAQDAVLATLKNLGHSVTAAQIGVATAAVKTQAETALSEKAQRQYGIEKLTLELAPLVAERRRWEQANPRLTQLSVRINATRDAELRLVYRTSNAGWQPVYRAQLDSASGKLSLERRAEVAQNSGEDWSGVTLKLSTYRPDRSVQGSEPGPWLLSILPPEPPLAKADTRLRSMAAPAPAPAPASAMFESVAVQGTRVSFDASVFEGEFATEFAVPGRVNVASSGERITFSLGQTALDARLLARIDPQAEAQAYLVAEAQRPAGVWPAGSAQLFLDGVFVGESQLAMPANGKLDLPFGRDELLRVVVEPQARNAGDRGFISSRVEQKIAHVYRIESRHSKPFTVQVLEATPVSQHEDIKVQARFDPQPLPKDWRENQGVKAWEFTLAPNATQKLSAEYTISWPKDARISGAR